MNNERTRPVAEIGPPFLWKKARYCEAASQLDGGRSAPVQLSYLLRLRRPRRVFPLRPGPNDRNSESYLASTATMTERGRADQPHGHLFPSRSKRASAAASLCTTAPRTAWSCNTQSRSNATRRLQHDRRHLTSFHKILRYSRWPDSRHPKDLPLPPRSIRAASEASLPENDIAPRAMPLDTDPTKLILSLGAGLAVIGYWWRMLRSPSEDAVSTSSRVAEGKGNCCGDPNCLRCFPRTEVLKSNATALRRLVRLEPGKDMRGDGSLSCRGFRGVVREND